MWQDRDGRMRYVLSAAEPNAMGYIVIRHSAEQIGRSNEEELRPTFATRAEAQTALNVYAVEHRWRQVCKEAKGNGPAN